MRLRWKKEEPLTGLARIGAPPRGSKLHDGKVTYASISCLGRRHDNKWYFVAGWGSCVPHKNTCAEPVETEQEAKKAAFDYVKQHAKP